MFLKSLNDLKSFNVLEPFRTSEKWQLATLGATLGATEHFWKGRFSACSFPKFHFPFS